MSFYRIEDPEKRDEMVEDYVATMKRLKQRAREERMGDTYRRQQLIQQWQPVVQSNEKMVERFAEDLKPIKTEVKNLSRHIKQEIDSEEEEDLPRKRRRIAQTDDDYGPLASKFKTRVLTGDPDLDKTFGLHFTNEGKTAMGNKIVNINGDDLMVGNEFYKGTPGLWNLITNTKQDQIGQTGIDFEENDLGEYIRLLAQTNVLYRDFDPASPYPRSNGSWKWSKLLKPVWDGWKKDGEASGSGLLQDPVESYKTYIQKKGKCYRVQTTVDGEGLFLSRHPRLREVGDGLFLRRGRNVYDGEGLMFGANSPFKDIPILGWIL